MAGSRGGLRPEATHCSLPNSTSVHPQNTPINPFAGQGRLQHDLLREALGHHAAARAAEDADQVQHLGSRRPAPPRGALCRPLNRAGGGTSPTRGRRPVPWGRARLTAGLSRCAARSSELPHHIPAMPHIMSLTSQGTPSARPLRAPACWTCRQRLRRRSRVRGGARPAACWGVCRGSACVQSRATALKSLNEPQPCPPITPVPGSAAVCKRARAVHEGPRQRGAHLARHAQHGTQL